MEPSIINIRPYALDGTELEGNGACQLYTRRYRTTIQYRTLKGNHGEYPEVYRWRISSAGRTLEWLVNHQHYTRERDPIFLEGAAAFTPSAPIRNPHTDPEFRRIWAAGYARAAERFAMKG